LIIISSFPADIPASIPLKSEMINSGFLPSQAAKRLAISMSNPAGWLSW